MHAAPVGLGVAKLSEVQILPRAPGPRGRAPLQADPEPCCHDTWPSSVSSPLPGRQVPTHLQGLSQLIKGPVLRCTAEPPQSWKKAAEGHARGSWREPGHAMALASLPLSPVSQGHGSRAVFTVIVTWTSAAYPGQEPYQGPQT